MDYGIISIIVVVILALGFDFINGFHDTANAIATSISTRALTPRRAILLASSLNLVGALVFTGVAKTIGGSIADPAKLEHGMEVVMAALISAIAWNLITWWFGIPSSSSHALIGSLSGAVISNAGIDGINASGFTSIVKALIVSPIIAFVVGYIVMTILKRVFAYSSPHKVNKGFRFLQVFSAGFQAFTHGTNDAQKAMGIIVFALVAGGFQTEGVSTIPLWVKISAALAMALGTSIGGWKIIKTMGTKMYKIEPINGFAADLTSSSIIFTFTKLELPVSSTHAITSAILGVGASKRASDVNWGIAGRIIVTWFITIPLTAAFAWLVYRLFALFL